MKKGDRVIVHWDDDNDSVSGKLVSLNVLLRTDRGGLINGTAGSIEELQEIVENKFSSNPAGAV